MHMLREGDGTGVEKMIDDWDYDIGEPQRPLDVPAPVAPVKEPEPVKEPV